MIILGIDPGLQKTGWGIIRTQGNHLSYLGSGLIRSRSEDTLAERLMVLHRGLEAVMQRFTPHEAAAEETFVNRNPASALKLGQARGVVLCVPALFGVSVAEYGANRVKKSIVGTGHASKEQIGMMIRRLLPNCGEIGEDEADSLAVAITHAHYRNISSLQKQVQA